MSWSEIIGHEAVVERFKRAALKGRLVSTYLFVGPDGIGKRKFALKLAQAVLCEVNPEEQLEPCGSCPGCQQVAASTHPDLIQIAKPEDKANIPVETFIGDRDHRMQVGLCHDISLKPFSGSRKVAIIDDSDALNQESANALLKTLEDPPKAQLSSCFPAASTVSCRRSFPVRKSFVSSRCKTTRSWRSCANWNHWTPKLIWRH